jgi:two-component system phosphate regulon sensor histidine kinase PhoR
LLLGAFAPIVLTLAGLDFYLTRYTADRERDAVAHQLAGQARSLAGELDAGAPADLAAWARAAARRAGARVTLIGPQGAVFADSQGDARTMENHGGRREVRAALRGEVGVATRRSATLDVDLSYVAVPLTYRGQPGNALRLALPLRDIDSSIAAVRRRILAATAAAALVALLLAYWLSRRFTRRVRRLQAFAESLLGARSAQNLPPDASDELGDLARSLTRTSAQLRELFEQLSVESCRREAILASMVEGVLAVDHQLRVTFCNEAFARAVGARLPVAANAPALELVRDPEFIDMLGRVVASGGNLKLRLQLTAAEGRAFEVQAAPLAGAGARRGAIAILHDITDLERLERVRKDFVANVSHELRTPLTAIRGYAETLLDGALEDQENNRRFLEIIRAHSVRLNNIASDLLALSELESGGEPAASEPVSVREALEAALHTVESEARLREVALKPGAFEDACVPGRRIRLEQALVNLLDNAIKFNRPGGEVLIEVRRDAGGLVRIEIADTGVGSPSEDLPRIFERFYRVDKARSREVGGTGLGLSIVKHVVERMHGTVAVSSRLGEGSTFTLTLPCC